MMPGLSIWLRSKSTKPISVVMTIRQGHSSSSFEKVESKNSQPGSGPECLYLSVHRHNFGIICIICTCQSFYGYYYVMSGII